MSRPDPLRPRRAQRCRPGRNGARAPPANAQYARRLRAGPSRRAPAHRETPGSRRSAAEREGRGQPISAETFPDARCDGRPRKSDGSTFRQLRPWRAHLARTLFPPILPTTLSSARSVRTAFQRSGPSPFNRSKIYGQPWLDGKAIRSSGFDAQGCIANYLNRAVFATPAPGTIGGSVRNSIRGPGYWNGIDLAVRRLISFSATQSVELRVGRITAQAGNPRIMQFGMKCGF